MFYEEICLKFEGESWVWWMYRGRFDGCELKKAKLDGCKSEQSFIVKEKNFEK